jgi:SMC interacting uncharacterized protein involved in chromosome segregation
MSDLKKQVKSYEEMHKQLKACKDEKEEDIVVLKYQVESLTDAVVEAKALSVKSLDKTDRHRRRITIALITAGAGIVVALITYLPQLVALIPK